MKLILMRHGQTPSNVAGVLDTAPPGPGLTELGQRQAKAVPPALAAEPIASIFASNQTRAQQTAAPLANTRGIDVAILPGLREIAAGELEMAGDADSVHRYIGTLITWLQGDLSTRIPGGPNGFEFLQRYDEAVNTIVENVLTSAGPDGSAVVVSHGAAIRAWATSRAANSADMAVTHAPMPSPQSAPPAAHGRHLDNTGTVTLNRDPSGLWTILDWRSQAIGGAALDEPAASGPTR